MSAFNSLSADDIVVLQSSFSSKKRETLRPLSPSAIAHVDAIDPAKKKSEFYLTNDQFKEMNREIVEANKALRYLTSIYIAAVEESASKNVDKISAIRITRGDRTFFINKQGLINAGNLINDHLEQYPKFHKASAKGLRRAATGKKGYPVYLGAPLRLLFLTGDYDNVYSSDADKVSIRNLSAGNVAAGDTMLRRGIILSTAVLKLFYQYAHNIEMLSRTTNNVPSSTIVDVEKLLQGNNHYLAAINSENAPVDFIHYSVPLQDGKKKTVSMSQVALKHGLRLNWDKAVSFLASAPAKLQNDFRAIVQTDKYLSVAQAANAASNGTYIRIFPATMPESQTYFLQPNQYNVKKASGVLDDLNALISADTSIATRNDVADLKQKLETFINIINSPENVEKAKEMLMNEYMSIQEITLPSKQAYEKISSQVAKTKNNEKTAASKERYNRFVADWYRAKQSTTIHPPTKTAVEEVIKMYKKTLSKEQKKNLTLEQIYSAIFGNLLSLPPGKRAPPTKKS